MKTIITISLAALFVACGAAPETDELGQDQEAVTAAGNGFSRDNNTSACVPSLVRTCYGPATKHLVTPNVVLTGNCATSLWNDAYTLGKAAYNGNVSGTGFNTANTQISGFDPVITARCVTTGTKRLNVSALGGVVCFGAFCEYSTATLDVQGDLLVGDCTAAHMTNTQCRAMIANIWQSGLNHLSGTSDFPVSMAPSAPDYQRMLNYAP